MVAIHMTLNIVLSSPAVTVTAGLDRALLSIHGTGETQRTLFIRYLTLHRLYLPLTSARPSL